MISNVSSAIPLFQAAPVTAKSEPDPRGGEARESARAETTATTGRPAELSEAELNQVRELKQIDRSVRAHEMAHVAAGGALVTRGASFSYVTGPDGQRYAVGGEVQIDTSPGRTEEETITKASAIIAAALAPADPSPQDRKVAAMASRMAAQASIELAIRQREENDPTANASEAGAARASDDTAAPQADDNRAAISPFVGDRARARYDDITALIEPQQTARINAFA